MLPSIDAHYTKWSINLSNPMMPGDRKRTRRCSNREHSLCSAMLSRSSRDSDYQKAWRDDSQTRNGQAISGWLRGSDRLQFAVFADRDLALPAGIRSRKGADMACVSDLLAIHYRRCGDGYIGGRVPAPGSAFSHIAPLVLPSLSIRLVFSQSRLRPIH